MIAISHKEILSHNTVTAFGDEMPHRLAGLIAGREWQVIEGDNIVPVDAPEETIELLGNHALQCIFEQPPEFRWSPIPRLPGRVIPNVRWNGFQSIFMGKNVFTYARKSMVGASVGDTFTDIMSQDLSFYYSSFNNTKVRIR